MQTPFPTQIYRLIHIDNLAVYLHHKGMHAPTCWSDDGINYKTIHNTDIQRHRKTRLIQCGPKGVIHDYVSFYLGPRSPMLLQLHTGQVEGYVEGQEPLIYLVSTAQQVHETGLRYVFSDGHGVFRFTRWYEDIKDLSEVDWQTVYSKYWSKKDDDTDRQRRKQAEFLVHKFFSWDLVNKISVLNETIESQVNDILNQPSPSTHRPLVEIKKLWYY